jgi:hypothetical protein
MGIFSRLFRKKKRYDFHISELFPTSYEGMKSSDVAFIVALKNEITDLREKKKYDGAGVLVLLVLRRLISYPPSLKLRRAKSILKQLTADQKADIYNDLFIHEPWYRFYLPGIRAGQLLFKAPDEKLADVTFNNFKYIDAEFSKCAVLAYHQKDFIPELARLVATLYLPYNGIERIDFVSQFIEDHAAMLKRNITINEGILILNTYGNIRSLIIDKHRHLFPKADNVAAKAKPVFTGQSWKNMHYSLAETDAFRGYKVAGDANVWDALGYLDHKEAERKRQIKKK